VDTGGMRPIVIAFGFLNGGVHALAPSTASHRMAIKEAFGQSLPYLGNWRIAQLLTLRHRHHAIEQAQAHERIV
jgi:hypothetical protein